MPKPNGSAGSFLFSCQLAQTLAFNPPHQLGWQGVEQWKLPSMMTCLKAPSFPNPLLLFTLLSQQKASRLLQNWKYILNKMMLWHFHPLRCYIAMAIGPVLFYSEKLSEPSLRNCYVSSGCPGVWYCLSWYSLLPLSINYTMGICMHGCKELLTKGALHLETPEVHSACTDDVGSRSEWFKTGKENRGMLTVHAPHRVHPDGNKSRKILTWEIL